MKLVQYYENQVTLSLQVSLIAKKYVLHSVSMFIVVHLQKIAYALYASGVRQYAFRV